jgi:hypothetical protein
LVLRQDPDARVLNLEYQRGALAVFGVSKSQPQLYEPFSVNLTALSRRLTSTWRSLLASVLESRELRGTVQSKRYVLSVGPNACHFRDIVTSCFRSQTQFESRRPDSTLARSSTLLISSADVRRCA